MGIGPLYDQESYGRRVPRYARARGAGAFTPAALFAGGEDGDWWTAKDAGTVDAAVASLTGKSNSITISQATGASQPILRQDAGGSSYLEFDGTDDFLAVNEASLRITGDLTIMVGFYLPNTGGFEELVTCQTNTSTVAPYECRVNNGTAGSNLPLIVLQADGATLSGANSDPGALVAPATKTIITARRNSGVDFDFFLEEEGRSASELDKAQTVVPTSDANSEFQLGNRAGSSLSLNGRIYEALVINRQLTNEEIQDTEAFFADRMGITI